VSAGGDLYVERREAVMRELLSWLCSRLGSDDGEDGGADEGSVWDAIPSWQYEGRLAESGGITRGEQERALTDIERRAKEIDEREGER
jgi:hypothetical protein